MKPLFRPLLPGRRAMSAVLLVHLLALLVLAASPQVHRWVHGDADAADHDCAVVLFAHGGMDHAAGPVVVPVFVVKTTGFVPQAVAPGGKFVPSVFATGRVFEHGPPTAG